MGLVSAPWRCQCQVAAPAAPGAAAPRPCPSAAGQGSTCPAPAGEAQAKRVTFSMHIHIRRKQGRNGSVRSRQCLLSTCGAKTQPELPVFCLGTRQKNTRSHSTTTVSLRLCPGLRQCCIRHESFLNHDQLGRCCHEHLISHESLVMSNDKSAQRPTAAAHLHHDQLDLRCLPRPREALELVGQTLGLLAACSATAVQDKTLGGPQSSTSWCLDKPIGSGLPARNA